MAGLLVYAVYDMYDGAIQGFRGDSASGTLFALLTGAAALDLYLLYRAELCS